MFLSAVHCVLHTDCTPVLEGCVQICTPVKGGVFKFAHKFDGQTFKLCFCTPIAHRFWRGDAICTAAKTIETCKGIGRFLFYSSPCGVCQPYYFSLVDSMPSQPHVIISFRSALQSPRKRARLMNELEERVVPGTRRNAGHGKPSLNIIHY